MICYLELLLTLTKIPIITKFIIKLEPPYDKKGKVTPVTGNKPITTPILMKN